MSEGLAGVGVPGGVGHAVQWGRRTSRVKATISSWVRFRGSAPPWKKTRTGTGEVGDARETSDWAAADIRRARRRKKREVKR